MKINREDVVQAALIVERWCREQQDPWLKCDCPFSPFCPISGDITPADWDLENYLRSKGLKRRGLKHAET